jgi:hypothetical protein
MWLQQQIINPDLSFLRIYLHFKKYNPKCQAYRVSVYIYFFEEPPVSRRILPPFVESIQLSWIWIQDPIESGYSPDPKTYRKFA